MRNWPTRSSWPAPTCAPRRASAPSRRCTWRPSAAAAPSCSLLVKAGADVDARTSTGATPLMFAAASGDVAAVKALLDGGADVEAKERDREQTPLIFAAAANRVDAVKLLLASGANKNAATKVIDLMALSANGENPDGRNLAAKPETPNGAAARGAATPAHRRRRRGRGCRASTAATSSTSRCTRRAA